MGFGLAAKVVDGGIGLVAADAGEAVADFGADVARKAAVSLQGFAAFIGCALAFLPCVATPALVFEVVFGEGNKLCSNTAHHGAVVGGVFE